jgi:hypothetical protein
MNPIVELKTKPIIAYDLVELKGKEVKEFIDSLQLENISANEDNLSNLKQTRATLSKDFKTFEEQRKMVKDLIMKPYNDFNDSYNINIATIFKDTDKLLKSKIDEVENYILKEKIYGIIEYFNEVNIYDFIKFEDLKLKIVKSKSDSSIKEEIDIYLGEVEANINMINTLSNKERILAKYELTKDIKRAISETQLEVKHEEKIIKNEPKNPTCAKNAQAPKEEQVKLLVASFEVTGTRSQFDKLKECMKELGIKYKSL